MNIKAILASTLLTALFASTASYADGDKDIFERFENETSSAVVIQKASLQTVSYDVAGTLESSSK